MHFDVGAFNHLLNDMGQEFELRTSRACPCVNPQSGAAKPNCPHCGGKGRIWGSPVVGRAGVVGRDTMQQFAQFGVWDQGDIMLSIPSDSPIYQAGLYDRLRSQHRTEPFSINLIRGMNDLVRFQAVSFDEALWLDSANVLQVATVSGVDAHGRVVWGSNPPPNNTTYSLTGRRFQDFFLYQEIPYDRPMHYGMALPRRVVLRRFDLFGR